MYHVFIPQVKLDKVIYRKVGSFHTKALANQIANGVSVDYNIERDSIWIASDKDLKDITIDV